VCELGGVEVDRSALEDVPLACDAGLCVQALVNLVRNAVEAMEGRGRLCVGARVAIELDGSGAERGWAVLSVRDSGPGIPPDVVERMFNPFFTTRATGTGLGLAIVHRILDAHAGRVEVVSREGDGATVELWFPAPDGACRRAGPERVTTGSDARTAAA